MLDIELHCIIDGVISIDNADYSEQEEKQNQFYTQSQTTGIFPPPPPLNTHLPFPIQIGPYYYELLLLYQLYNLRPLLYQLFELLLFPFQDRGKLNFIPDTYELIGRYKLG
ncbi:MAG: hypothetical protein EZS28_017121 [Streblomastix strix]|uniref:Uncharacterized protein n=1 Tax=Streblomastix strix TaxID=222440 RepID=A0A5J4VXA7_9EUKA|nr:MAG: hypothetical protein EZS28_017121 [Streblomastix strix]